MHFYPAADAAHIADFADRTLVLVRRAANRHGVCHIISACSISDGDVCCVAAVQPGEAVGNVGQLAVDLLIVRHSLTRIGYLETPLVQPCAGLNAYDDSGKVHLAMELYAEAGTGEVMLQQRAPVLRGCQAQFAAQLADWLQTSGFTQARLTSLDGAYIMHVNTRWCSWSSCDRRLHIALAGDLPLQPKCTVRHFATKRQCVKRSGRCP